MTFEGYRITGMWFDEYSDWIEVVTSSRDENHESLKELTAGWDLTKVDWMQVPEATIEYTPEEVAMYKAVNWAQIHGVAAMEKDPFKGRRFVGISEPPASDVVDNEFLMRFTGPDAEWVEVRNK